MPYQHYLQSISSPRSNTYRRVFRTQTEAETCGAVLWGQAMTASLQTLLTTFEVALRNRIHVSLSKQASLALGSPVSVSFPWYDPHLKWCTLQGKTLEKVEKLLCGDAPIRITPPLSPDRVISGLSFGVWSNILDSQLPTPSIEEETFREVFPHHPKARKHWRFSNNRKSAVADVKDVQNWRNRISHCKPVWSEGWYRNNPNADWTGLLLRLKSRRARAVEVLGWICADTAKLYTQSYCDRLFHQLVTDDAVLAYVHQPLNPCSGPTYPVASPQQLAAYKARR